MDLVRLVGEALAGFGEREELHDEGRLIQESSEACLCEHRVVERLIVRVTGAIILKHVRHLGEHPSDLRAWCSFGICYGVASGPTTVSMRGQMRRANAAARWLSSLRITLPPATAGQPF